MESLTLFKLMDAKLAYVSQRQGVIANNIANANTPNYKAYDVKAPDFKAILNASAPVVKASSMTLTNGVHIDIQALDGVDAKAEAGSSYEISPDGNAIDIEEQMLKASKNSSDATIVTGLYAKQLSLLRMAIGKEGR